MRGLGPLQDDVAALYAELEYCAALQEECLRLEERGGRAVEPEQRAAETPAEAPAEAPPPPSPSARGARGRPKSSSIDFS